MSIMLISTSTDSELRVALVKDKILYDLDVERLGHETKKSNIHKGRIIHIAPSLEAAFVDYGGERHGFLPIKEVARSCFQGPVSEHELSHPNIREVLKEGQEILVQVEKEERGSKGAALTTFISLAGSYLVLTPNNPRASGISRRIEGQGRDELRESLSQLEIPEDMGVIIRTAGVGKSLEELQWDLNAILKLWAKIAQAAQERSAPCLIYQEGDVVSRAIRDYLRPDNSEIIIDNTEIYEKAKNYLQQARPEFLNNLHLYQKEIPLFCAHNIEHQIESAHQRIVRLPSGGFIVIDHTEALVSVDVNSGKATSGGDIEETALNTNLEAANEIARQLRLRDIGGLIVIDFIDMDSLRNQRDVGNTMRDALKPDHAKVQIGKISRFGLLEMSRQRIRPSLIESSSRIPCPRCNGQGTIRGIESLAISILRIITEDAIKEHTSEIHVQLPIDLATFLLNEKRDQIHDIEKQHNVRILLIPNHAFETPNYLIKRLSRHEAHEKGNTSYKLLEVKEAEMPKAESASTKPHAAPAVTFAQIPMEPSPHYVNSFDKMKKLLSNIFGKSKSKTEVPQQKTAQKPTNAETQPQTDSDTAHAKEIRRRRTDYNSRKRTPYNQPGKNRKRVSQDQTENQDTSQVSTSEEQQPQRPYERAKFTPRRTAQRPDRRRISSRQEYEQPTIPTDETYPEINAERSKIDEDFLLAKEKSGTTTSSRFTKNDNVHFSAQKQEKTKHFSKGNYPEDDRNTDDWNGG